MSTIFIIILSISGGMILFSLFDKGEKARIKKSREIIKEKTFEEQTNEITHQAIKEVMTSAIKEERMPGLVSMIQMTYVLHNAKVDVSHNNTELILNIREPNLVQQYYDMQYVLENTHSYSAEDIFIARNFVPMLKAAGIKTLQAQNTEEKALFRKAGVSKYTSQIDGNIIYSVDYY